MDRKLIENISTRTEQAIKRKSAFGLPDRPAESGMRSDEIKKAFYASITDGDDSVLSEVKRVVNEANDIFEEVQEELDNKIGNEKSRAIDFAESERQKSKNLLVYPYTGGSALYGIEFVDNGDGTFTINGKQSSTTYHSTKYLFNFNNWTDKISPFKLKAGTYTFGLFGESNVGVSFVFTTDGSNYYNAQVGDPKTITITEEKSFEMYIQISKTNTYTFNNFVVKPMIVSGTELGEWQAWNGKTLREIDIKNFEHIETIYNSDSSDGNINWGYHNTGIRGGIKVTGKDFSKYKKLIVHVSFNTVISTYEIDLTKQTYTMLDTPLSDYRYNSIGSINSESHSSLYSSITLVNNSKTEIYHYSIGYYTLTSNTWNDRGNEVSNGAGYYIYKIEGVY